MSELWNLEAHWLWLILAAVLGIAEILIPGFFLIWIGLAAMVTGLVTMGLGLIPAAQFGLFALLAIIAVYAGRRWFITNPIESADPLLNDRASRLIGEVVTVVEPIEAGSGRVKVGDGVWTAYGEDATLGTRLRVTGSKGSGLTVGPL